MDVRAQVAMTFHLDKCIGCHTCSIACKNVWTDRKGAEYMWWNNVETKPGTGYPTAMGGPGPLQGRVGEDRRAASISAPWARCACHHRVPQPESAHHRRLLRALYLPVPGPLRRQRGVGSAHCPACLDDHRQAHGHRGGPQLGRRPGRLADLRRQRSQPGQLQRSGSGRSCSTVQRLVFFYLPRICNHCANPSCVASCPSGALYKRGEDGIVLHQPGALPGLALLCYRLSVQEDLFQLVHRQEREVHSVLPAAGERRSAGVLPLLCRPHPLPGAGVLRRRPDSGGRQRAPGPAGGRPAQHPAGPQRSEGHRRCRKEQDPPGRHRARSAFAGLEVRQGVGPGSAAPRRAPHPAHVVLRAAAAAGDGQPGRRGATTPPSTTSWATSITIACP